jgi:hypothetical protein
LIYPFERTLLEKRRGNKYLDLDEMELQLNVNDLTKFMRS